MQSDIVVAMRPVLSIEGRARIARDGLTVEADCVRSVLNRADLVALEAALKLKEAGCTRRVICLAIGASAVDDVLAHGVAMGADDTVRVPFIGGPYLDARVVGQALAAAIRTLGGRLVFTASQSPDAEAEAVPHMMATALGAACITNVTALRLTDGGLEAERWLEQGRRQIWGARLPAVLAFDARAEQPRYITVAALALARRTLAPRLLAGKPAADSRLTGAATSLYKLAPRRIPPKRVDGGGHTRRASAQGGGQRLNGPPDRLADMIVAYLHERGLLE